MKSIRNSQRYHSLLLVCLMLIFAQCEEENIGNNWPEDPVVILSASKMPGHAQYTASHEYSANAEEVSIDVAIKSAAGIGKFYITKTVNLKVDSTYGENGVLTVDPASLGSDGYTFTYSPVLEDVNQLIGFTFTAINANGVSHESDLTLAVNLSPRNNLPLKKWNLKSIIFVNGDPPNQETIQDCRKDDYMLLNSDSTWSMEYNTICFLEGLERWRTWSLSEDNKVLTLVKVPNAFQPDNTKTDVFEVKELTLTTFNIQQTVDMTALGGGPEDTFLYKYVALPR